MVGSEHEFRSGRVDDVRSINRYARIGGVLILVSLAAGLFGEVYAPSLVKASATGAAIAHGHLMLLRAGFASYLIEAFCDVTLTLTLYVIFRPVSRNLALLAVFFRLVSTAVFASAMFFYLGALLLLDGANGYLKTFSADQLNAVTKFLFDVYGFGGSAPMFYGAAAIVVGYLIYRSGYLPKFLGGLWILGGMGQLANIFALALAPGYAFFWELLPLLLAMLSLAVWLLVRGVDATRWSERNSKCAKPSIM
jgi:hypothetical protein